MKYYITTPIYYVNDKPHIGHAYCTIASDIIALHYRMRGDDVFFLTGVDENSQKNVEAAEKLGMGERIQEYLDIQASLWRETWDSLGITNSDFIRTTEERHKIGVEKFWHLVEEKGDITKGEYEGLYCVGCEEFIRPTDLVDGLCAIHKRVPEKLLEQNYFFAAKKYRDRLLAYIDDHPDFIQPTHRKNEIINYIQNHFDDISISRQRAKCGIPVPGDPEQAVYVWFDALINYLTGIGFGWNDELFVKYWPADLHLVGKEIIKFHCALWPAMLMSAGLPLPEHVFAHGFFTIDGQKISKSLGNVVDPVEVAKEYGIDVLRYFLTREIPFGGDGDFSFDRLAQRYESDLQKGIGNFVARVLAMAEKIEYVKNEKKSDRDDERAIGEQVRETWLEYEEAFDRFAIDDALASVWHLLSSGDKFIEEKKPWVILKENKEEYTSIMGVLLELMRQVSTMLYPFMPQTSESIWRQLGIEEQQKGIFLSALKEWRAIPISTIHREGALFPPRVQ